MKRKIFSKLLMGAFLFASVSAFVSCKDYDDDINANKAEIKAVQDQLTTLTSNLNSLKTELQTQKTALQQELATAKSQLETQIADAKAELNTAIDKKADQSSVDALASKVATLESNLAALNAAYEAKMSAIDSALASLQALIEKKADITYVDNAIAILNAAVDGKVAKEDFGAFKSEVNNLKNDLNNLSALVDTKADQKDIDHAVEKINEKLAALIEQMKTTVPQSDIANIQETIKALQASVNSLTQAVAAKAEQSAVDQLNAFYKELKENVNDNFAKLQAQVDALVTPAMLQEAINTLKEEIEKKGAEESARLEDLIAKVQKEFGENLAETEKKFNEKIAGVEKTVDENKKAAEDALKAAVEEINTALGTKANVKDLEKAVSDFNAAKKAIEDDIITKYTAVTGDIEKANKLINDINDALKAEIAKKADLSDFNKFKQDFAELNLNERVAACEALIIQVKAINDFLGDLKNGTLASKLADLKKDMSDDAAKKVQAEAEDRAKAIEEVNTEIAKVKENLTNEIAELNKKLYGEGEVTGDIDKLQADTKKLTEDFSKIDEKVQNKINENLSNLVLFVSKSLKSISLVPQLFIGGIEAIEFTSLQYTPMLGGTSGLGRGTHNQYVAKANPVRVDDGTAEAYYRLNPSIVDRASLDEDNIEFLAATAETRAATVKSPVEFNGISEWNYQGKKGLIKVNLKKADWFVNDAKLKGDLNTPPSGDIYIVALKVPRKETTVAGQKVDAADIVSENSRLVEKIRTPRIAKLPWKGRDNEVEMLDWKDGNGAHAAKGYNTHHFTDSVTMYQQDVDAKELVYAEVAYNKTFDVAAIVTACDIETPLDAATCAGIDDNTAAGYVAKHTKNDHQITVDQLKKYGLEFRFAIPTKEYKMDVDHSTDQQKFAKVDPITGIVTATVPQLDGTSIVDNRACVGKEPIIRIELIDTKNGNIVDQRYMKIKWIEEVKKPVHIGDYETSSVLKPCDLNGEVGVKWLWFIDKAYANGVKEINGMSQKTFAAVYMDPAHLPTVGAVTYTGTHLSLLSAAQTPGKPVVKQTTNEQGDALIATWSMMPAEIANIYPSESKTFTAKITFHSILPTEYPDLSMNFKWTITLPTLPQINGYYDNYWFDKYAEHYVLPVQYNTAQYNLIKNGKIVPGKTYGIDAPAVGMQLYNKANNTVEAGTDYCVFYNSITNPFSYELKKDVPQFIVKNLLGECSTWDMQFTWTGPDAIKGNGVWDASTNKWSKVGAADPTYQQFAGYRPASNTNSPALSKINWKTAGAYKLETNAGKQALQLEWWGQKQDFHATGEYDQSDDAHVAWDNVNSAWGGKKYNYAVLYADHHNPANQALLNKITPKEIGVAPEYSHTKGIQMGIWGTLNDWNIIPVKNYKFYLVEPLAINANLKGAFEEGYASGTCVRCDDAFEMTDFRGYEVKNTAPAANAGEFVKYRQALWKYYEVEDPEWNLADVKYGLKVNGNEIKSDDTNKMTAAQISILTNGNIRLSVEKKTWNGVDYLVFKNNGGSNVEEEVWIYIPVKAKYGFGEVTKEAKVRLYPRGKVASGVTINAYPGNN
jgi:septal ring factor EnvC (AmiA/AmiB activator)